MMDLRASRKRTLLLRLLLAYAVGGVIINVAVAWGFAAFAPVRHVVSHSGPISIVPSHPLYWSTAVIRQPGGLLVDAVVWRDKTVPPMDPQLPAWSATRNPPPHASVPGIREIAYGWPMLTVYSRGGWAGNDPIPSTPIWMGVAVNSVAYAILLFGASLGFRNIGLRRRIRARRGLCPACAYDLRGSASQNCPECGAVVRTQEA